MERPPDESIGTESTGTPDESAGTPTERDPDLVALEGLEAEFAELEAELERVERSRGEDPSPDDG